MKISRSPYLVQVHLTNLSALLHGGREVIGYIYHTLVLLLVVDLHYIYQFYAYFGRARRVWISFVLFGFSPE